MRDSGKGLIGAVLVSIALWALALIGGLAVMEKAMAP